jgi:hypothetical protein
VAAISLILFDLNGVLYRYNRDARIAYLASISQRPAAAIKTATWDSGFEDLGDAGALDAAAYLSAWPIGGRCAAASDGLRVRIRDTAVAARARRPASRHPRRACRRRTPGTRR